MNAEKVIQSLDLGSKPGYAGPPYNRATRRAAAAITRRMLRAGDIVRTTTWGSPRSNEARVRFAALNRKAVALVGTETI